MNFIPAETTEEVFECVIFSKDVKQIKLCCKESQRVLFFFLSVDAGMRLKEIFDMEEGSEEYFDPSSMGELLCRKRQQICKLVLTIGNRLFKQKSKVKKFEG